MLKIRLMRIGTNKRPFYRVVAVDERAKRTGAYVELLGTYNPLTEPKDIKLKQDRIDYWIKQGAQMSDGFLRIIGKAPQRPPRKPKKQKKEEPAAVSPQTSEEKKEETVPTEEPKTEEISLVEEPKTGEPAEEVETEKANSELEEEKAEEAKTEEETEEKKEEVVEEEKNEGSA